MSKHILSTVLCFILRSTAYYANGDSRPEGLGWRLDTFIVSKRFASRVKQCEIRHKVYGASDHVPVVSRLPLPQNATPFLCSDAS